MAKSNVGNLAVVISGNASPLQSVMNQSVRDVQNFTQTINRISVAAPKDSGGGGMGLGAGMMAGIAGGATIKALDMVTSLVTSAGRAAIKGAADWEKMSIAFEVMTGSASKGSSLLKQIEDLAIRSSYSSAELADAGRMLLGFGANADSITPMLSRMGDVAGGNSESLSQLALNFGQVLSKGKLLGDDMRTFSELGLGVDQFSNAMGISTTEFYKRMEAGQISANHMIQTLNMATSEGGRFYESTAKQNKSVAGEWEALNENVAKSLRGIGLEMFKAFDVAGNIHKLSEFTTSMSQMADQVRTPFERARTILGDFGQIAGSVLNGLIETAKPFTKAIQPLVDTINGLSFDKSREDFLEWSHVFLIGLGRVADNAVLFGQAWATTVGKPLTAVFQAILWGIKKVAIASADLMDSGFMQMTNPVAILAKRTGATDQLRSIAGTIDPGAFGAGSKALFDALDEAAKPENMGRGFKWNDEYTKQLEAAKNLIAKPAVAAPQADLIPKLAEHAIEIAPMPRLGPSKEMLDYAAKLKNDFIDGGARGLGHELNMLQKAREMGLITEDVFNRGAFKLHESLSKSFSDGSDKLPAAMARGTQAAEAVISRAMSGSRDPMRRVEDLLKQAVDELKRSTLREKEIGDAIRGLGAQGVGF